MDENARGLVNTDDFMRQRFPALFLSSSGAAVRCACGLLVVVNIAGAQDQVREHPLVPAIRLARESYAALQKVQDYEAVFFKRELVSGKLQNQKIMLRLREEPFSVYMKFIEPSAGREILFVEGRNQNQLRVHEAAGLSSLVGTISLAINSPSVMAENRHPITDVGMRRLLELQLKLWELESNYGEINVKFYPNARMGNVACEVIESSHPQPRKQFPFQMTRLFLDKQSRLPIRIENYGFPRQAGAQPPLVEEYTYTNVRTNVGLTDAHFDEKNPQYSF